MSTAEPTTWSPRRWILEHLEREWSTVRGGAYRVYRGPVVWAEWNFDANPRGVSLFTATITPLGVPSELNGAKLATFQMEVAAKIGDPERWGARSRECVDGLHDELLEDSESVLLALLSAVHSLSGEEGADAAVFRLDARQAIADAWFDAAYAVQGWNIRFTAAI